MMLRKKIKNLLVLLLTVVIFIEPITVSAQKLTAKADSDASTKELLETSVILLEDVIKSQYNSKIQYIKDTCYENKFDSELTMQSIAQTKNPFSSVDYTELIAAYITIADNNSAICDIDFFDVELKEDYIEEYTPYKAYTYKETEDGKYKQDEIYYILEPTTIDKYIKNTDGTYSKVGTEDIVPETRQVKYYDALITFKDAEDIVAEYNASERSTESKLDEYISRLEILHQSGVSAEGLRESIMLNTSFGLELDGGALNALNEAITNTDDSNRLALILTGKTLIGNVPYLWGGKASHPGYDYTWWTINEDGEQKGLDCSGFVSWVYETAGYSNYNQLLSTGAILKNTETISESELQIGDIGLLNNGESVNHTGIYVGNGYWMHCSSSANTVTITQFPFTIYKRVTDLDEYTLSAYEEEINSDISVQSGEAYLLAQLVTHEARGEGINGWIACTQVVMNRVRSERFPNSITEVVYADSQFENVEEISSIDPPLGIYNVVIATLNGQLQMFDNTNVLFFRNPHSEENEDWGEYKFFTRINNHVFYTL